MRNYYVYMLRCADGNLYTGYTLDPFERLRLHNLGLASKFTRSRLPVKLELVESYRSKSQALKREVAIKRFRHSEKILLISSRRTRH